MILGSETEKRQIVLRLFEKEFTFYVDENAIEVCEKIRKEAKEMLDNIECYDGESILEKVADFLEKSLETVIDKENVDAISECCEMTVTELTGILCCAISEIGLVFSDNEETEYA